MTDAEAAVLAFFKHIDACPPCAGDWNNLCPSGKPLWIAVRNALPKPPDWNMVNVNDFIMSIGGREIVPMASEVVCPTCGAAMLKRYKDGRTTWECLTTH
jgi:predicted RNA-binding Zn-ribbon protein involved in translation (DUF1610 family)